MCILVFWLFFVLNLFVCHFAGSGMLINVNEVELEFFHTTVGEKVRDMTNETLFERLVMV